MALAVTVAGLAGCGGSSRTGSGDAVQRAAEITAQAPGYRVSGTMSVQTPTGPAQISITGAIDRTKRTGTLTSQETVAGHRLSFQEVFSGLTFYVRTAGLPGLDRLTHGRPWLKFDMSRMLGAVGLGSLPTTGSDPSQFVDFLRAVSSSTQKLGSATIRGVATTHYRASVDLDRYPQLVAAADRPAAARSVASLESALGTHRMPIDAWVDSANRVRRISLSLAECFAQQRIHFGMTMDLYDYAAQATPQLPGAAQAYDMTPLLSQALSKVKLGCSSA